ncbi:MAG: hypothetical protein ABI305_05580 [Tepidiformaceae bacterium]
MHLLLLGNSNETVEWFEGAETAEQRLGRLLREEFNEDIQITAKSIWPDANMPATVGRWVERYRPDVVFLDVVGFWFLYQSVPLRLERIGGRAGKRLGEVGFGAAANRAVAHNRAFRIFRKTAQRIIGGDTHFTPRGVIERVSECIRTTIRHEGTVVVVSGAGGRVNHAVTRRGYTRNEAARHDFNQVLAAFCRGVHVHFVAPDEPEAKSLPKKAHIGDGLHWSAAGAVYRGDRIFRLVRDAWLTEHEVPAV